MVAKVEIVERLGEGAVLLPGLIEAGLAANDRLKIRLTLLQEASAQATSSGAAGLVRRPRTWPASPPPPASSPPSGDAPRMPRSSRARWARSAWSAAGRWSSTRGATRPRLERGRCGRATGSRSTARPAKSRSAGARRSPRTRPRRPSSAVGERRLFRAKRHGGRAVLAMTTIPPSPARWGRGPRDDLRYVTVVDVDPATACPGRFAGLTPIGV